MAAPTNILEAPIPRPVLLVATPIAAVLLIALFVFLGFPYDLLAGRIGAGISSATGAEVTIGGIEPRITIAGPGASLRDVRVTPRKQDTYFVDPLRIRPAWSLSWLRGEPAFRVDLQSPLGKGNGTLVLASAPSWDGEISEIDLSKLPLRLPNGIALTGIVSADAAVDLQADGPAGDVEFEATAGVLAHPAMPIDLQYDRVIGNVTLGGEHIAAIHGLQLEGPVLAATAGGTISRGSRPGRELLDLAVDIEIKTPAVQQMLRGFGVPLDRDGRASFGIGGTLAQPKLR